MLPETFRQGREQSHQPGSGPCPRGQEGWLPAPAGLSSTARRVPGTAQPKAAPQGWQGLPGDAMGPGAPTFGSKGNSSLSFPMPPTNLSHMEWLFTARQLHLSLRNLALTPSLPGWHQIQPKCPLPAPLPLR